MNAQKLPTLLEVSEALRSHCAKFDGYYIVGHNINYNPDDDGVITSLTITTVCSIVEIVDVAGWYEYNVSYGFHDTKTLRGLYITVRSKKWHDAQRVLTFEHEVTRMECFDPFNKDNHEY